MSHYQVNPARKYFNFEGRMPPLQLAACPTEIPAPSPRSYPKLITDTTLRAGAQDPCFAIFPTGAKPRYFALLPALDNRTRVFAALDEFIHP